MVDPSTSQACASERCVERARASIASDPPSDSTPNNTIQPDGTKTRTDAFPVRTPPQTDDFFQTVSRVFHPKFDVAGEVFKGYFDEQRRVITKQSLERFSATRSTNSLPTSWRMNTT